MNPRVEIFKTNVTEQQVAARLVNLLETYFPGCHFNFDLHDCDNILRIEGAQFDVEVIQNQVESSGYFCELL